MLESETVNCYLKTLSEVIREQKIQQIDLLKVDVKRSELDVLLGIEEQDWVKVKQIVVEVHDIKSKLKEIVTLLQNNQFTKIEVDQEPFFRNSENFNIYATKLD